MKEQGSSFRADVARFVSPLSPPRGFRLLLKVLGEPGLQFAWMVRLQMGFEARSNTRMARVVYLFNLRTTGGEFGHGCAVGPGLVVKHPLGVLIGGGTILGSNCTILHNVTFGERRPDTVAEGRMYPVVGDDCLIGTGAIVLGAINIGHGARIGAGAVVLRDVHSGETVVGAPAKPKINY